MNYSLSDLIAFMEREIQDDIKKGDSHDVREAYQRQIVEQLHRLVDLES